MGVGVGLALKETVSEGALGGAEGEARVLEEPLRFQRSWDLQSS